MAVVVGPKVGRRGTEGVPSARHSHPTRVSTSAGERHDGPPSGSRVWLEGRGVSTLFLRPSPRRRPPAVLPPAEVPRRRPTGVVGGAPPGLGVGPPRLRRVRTGSWPLALRVTPGTRLGQGWGGVPATLHLHALAFDVRGDVERHVVRVHPDHGDDHLRPTSQLRLLLLPLCRDVHRDVAVVDDGDHRLPRPPLGPGNVDDRSHSFTPHPTTSPTPPRPSSETRPGHGDRWKGRSLPGPSVRKTPTSSTLGSRYTRKSDVGIRRTLSPPRVPYPSPPRIPESRVDRPAGRTDRVNPRPSPRERNIKSVPRGRRPRRSTVLCGGSPDGAAGGSGRRQDGGSMSGARRGRRASTATRAASGRRTATSRGCTRCGWWRQPRATWTGGSQRTSSGKSRRGSRRPLRHLPPLPQAAGGPGRVRRRRGTSLAVRPPPRRGPGSVCEPWGLWHCLDVHPRRGPGLRRLTDHTRLDRDDHDKSGTVVAWHTLPLTPRGPTPPGRSSRRRLAREEKRLTRASYFFT